MLVVFNNEKEIGYNDATNIKPLQTNDLVVLVFDPSKSNFAMIVGTPYGRVIEIVEFSGNNRKKGPAMDTTEYCHQIKTFMSKYLANVNLYVVATEAAITQKGPKQNHVTNMVLTEIRATILGYFFDVYGIQVVQINNWSWKHSELPEGYRSPFQKMSKKYLMDTQPDHPLIDYFEEDACDVYFMYKYILKNMCEGYTLICDASETPRKDFDYFITSSTNTHLLPEQEMIYNDKYSVRDNLIYYMNRFTTAFYLKVPVTNFTLPEIYGHCREIGINILFEKEVSVVIC